MPRDINLNWLEVTGILTRLGMEELERFGGYAVYIGRQGDSIITITTEE